MAERSDFETWRKVNEQLRRLADLHVAKTVARVWDDEAEAERHRRKVADDLRRLLPPAMTEYSALSAGAAAEWYGDLRSKAGVVKPYRAKPVVPRGLEDSTRSAVAWALNDLFAEGPTDRGLVIAKLQNVSNKAALSGGRETVFEAVKRDPARVRYARVPSGASTCEFCLMLASRGAVYHSEVTADGGSDTWHGGNCQCVPTPFFEDEEYPEEYDPDALYQRWSEIVESKQGDKE